MKICFLCDEYPPARAGGIGSFVRDLGHELVRRGHKVTVVGVYPGIAGKQNEWDDGIRVVRLPASPSGGRRAFIRDRLRLHSELSRLVRRGVDVIEAPETGGWGIAAPSSTSLVTRMHSPARYMAREVLGRRRGRLLELVEDLAIRRARAVAAVSRWVAARARRDYPLARFGGRNIEVIYNGVDTSLFRTRPWSERVPGRIVFAGTLKPQKGIVALLRAIPIVLRRVETAELVLAGHDTMVDGRPYSEIATRQAEIGGLVGKRVRFLGPVSRERLPELYGSASVCVFPSVAESFGLVAAEAMAVGRPVVYSRATAGPELIEDGVTGLLADPSSPEEIANAVIRILTREEEARTMARRAAEEVRRRFSVERCAEATLSFYQRVLAGQNH